MRKVAPYGRNAPWSAIPFTIAPMPCSRTPKWRVRPAKSIGAPGAGPDPSILPRGALAALLVRPLHEIFARLVRNVERGLEGPSRRRLRALDLLGAERLAVRLGGSLLRGRALSDRGPRQHDRGTALLRDRRPKRRLDWTAFVAVDPLHVPAVGLEAAPHVLTERQLRWPLDRDVVVVVEVDEVSEAPVPRQRRRFGRHALHEIAVAHESEDPPVEEPPEPGEPRLDHALRERHTHAVAETLTQRTGRRFHPRCHPVLRMPGRLGLPLAEAPELVQRQIE